MMISLIWRHRIPGWGRTLLAALAATVLLAGCGGGGGGSAGGGGGGGGTTSTATLTGTLQDTTTGTPLVNRTVTVQGTALAGVTNAQGQFGIAGVPITTVTLVVTDSIGTQDGTKTVNLASLGSGATRSAGTITFDLSNLPPPPPIP